MRTRGSRMRGSSYGAQHDGSYVYVAPHDLHSHGSDYCSDSCDSGGSDSGRRCGGDGLLSETGAMAWFMGLPVAQRREMASVAFFMADSLLDSLDERGLTVMDLETRDALEGVEALLRACGTDTAALRATLDNYDQAAKDVPVEGTSTLLEQVWLAYPDDWWGRKPADVVEVAGVAELA